MLDTGRAVLDIVRNRSIYDRPVDSGMRALLHLLEICHVIQGGYVVRYLPVGGHCQWITHLRFLKIIRINRDMSGI